MLKDMKMSKKESKVEVMPSKDSGPEYPWGLAIDLNNESCKKLKVSATDFDVGEGVIIKARGYVKSVSSNQYEGNKEISQSVGIQITAMAIVSEGNFDEAFDEAAKKED